MLRKLEKYELLEEIGHGGMATVFRGRDERLDRLVAVKVLHPHLQKAPEARIRFTREARSVAKLKHPNILEVYDYSGEDSPESYIAAELLTGPTLKRFAEDHGALPPEIVAAIGIQIARALATAHQHGIVHRDVKPENVLFHEARTVKLTDFGIAQMVDAQSFTATGQILGSPGHMAPEQVEGGDIGACSDIFSLGTVLYFLAVGRLPFTGRNPHQVLKRIMDAEFADPLRVQPAIGGELRRIVLRAMAREPGERHASAEELEADLLAFLQGLELDDPDALLERYLADPEAVAAELRDNAIAVLTRRGREAMERKDRAAALECFNRVLALDEGNEEVLRLLDKLGDDGQRTLWLGGAALFLGAAALAAVLLWPEDGGGSSGSLDAGALVTDAGDGVLGDAGALDAAPAAPDAGPAGRLSRSAGWESGGITYQRCDSAPWLARHSR